MATYHVKMKHDHGTVTITAKADSANKAAELVCKIKRAPRSAVVSVKRDAKELRALERSISKHIQPFKRR